MANIGNPKLSHSIQDAAAERWSLSVRAPFLCPITGYPCEGDLSYLCEDYGCARKGGLSPRSEENL
jgi:hypothetical protein